MSDMKKTLLSIMLFVGVMLCSPSCMKEYPSMDEVPGDLIRFSTENMTAEVATKTAETTMSTLQTNGFNVSATTGSAGSETSAWNSVAFAKNGDLYTGNKFWPASNPNYHFYASNVALTHNAAGCTVAANANTDVVCAYLGTTTYKNTNNLTFEHIFARLCRIDVVAETGYDISGISVRMTPKTSGTYNLRTGAGQTDGTGWSSVSAGSQQTVATAKGANNNDIYTVPGTYSFTVTWTATNSSGSVTYTNQVVNLPLKGGKTNNVSLVLGGGVNFGIDLQDYCQYDYRDNLDYLTFYCDEAGTIGWKCSNASIARTIQYSKDFGATWTDLTSTTSGATVAVNAGDIVWFKGSNTEYYRESFWQLANSFTLSNKAHVYGNVNSLTGNNMSVSEYCFGFLFDDCSNLYTYDTKKIILPATTLADYCYYSMFCGCTSLTTAPELPATTLADSCYENMFDGCTSLTAAPELPATTLANNCYCSMFYNCSSLTTAPELPVTTMVTGCYNRMFYGCTSLRTAPELPATTLANSCYYYMFYGCTSLTAAPELPATTLVNGCYSNMFQGCSSLNYIKALFTTDPSSGSYTTNWVYNVAPTGTFVKSAAATWDVTGNNGVPTGWKVKKEFPSFGGLNIAPAPLYYDGVTFVIKDDDWNHDSYNSVQGKASGSYYFRFDQLGMFFDSEGASFSTSSGNIDNEGSKVSYGGHDDWRMPTQAEWYTLTTGESPGTSRSGSTVNGNAGSNYAIIQLDDVTYAETSTPVGLLLFPDGKTISGKALSGINNTTCTTGVTNAELQSYLNQGCAFLPASGHFQQGFWTNGGLLGYYWSTTQYSQNQGYTLIFNSENMMVYYYNKTVYFFSVRLVRDAN